MQLNVKALALPSGALCGLGLAVITFGSGGPRGIVIEDGAFFKGGIDIPRSQIEKPETISTSLSTAAGAGT